MTKRVIPMNGAYWQAFGWKKQARVACRPVSRACAAGTMFEGGGFARYPVV
jgi:hypothetical protein